MIPVLLTIALVFAAVKLGLLLFGLYALVEIDKGWKKP